MCLQDGDTPLSWASYKGHTETVKFLVENKADINAKDKVSMPCMTSMIKVTEFDYQHMTVSE